MDVLRQNPGPDESVGAGFPQALARNSEMRQFWQPTAIDLHVTHVETAVPVPIQGVGIAS